MAKKKKIGPPSKFDGTKLCWWCKHFRYDTGDGGYSEMTPGYEMTMRCNKDHWDFDTLETSEDEFRNMIHHAVDCKDFESNLLEKTTCK